MSDLEAQSRLRSIRDVLEHEGRALAALTDPRLESVVSGIEELQAAIIVALAKYGDRTSEIERRA